jgi:hypothetical protein
MKRHVVFDKHGNIVSAGYLDRPAPEAYDYLTPRFGPVAGDGQTVAELEVPEEYAKLPLTDLVERLQVDVRAERPTLIAKKS